MAPNGAFSLGQGLFGVASSSDDQPQQDPAQLWRNALIDQHLGAEQRAALSKASQQCFSQVVESAPHATITLLLQSNAASEPAATVQQLQLAAKALTTRGHVLLPTKVVLDQQRSSGKTSVSPAFSLVHEHLFVPAGQYIKHLQLSKVVLQVLRIFTPTSTGHTLQHFRTNTELDDMLLRLLLQQAPALQQLSVSRVHLQTDHSSSQWAVQELNLQLAERLDAMLALPTNRDHQRVRVHVQLRQAVLQLSNAGVPSNVLHLLDARVVLTNATIQLRCAKIPRADQAIVVCRALRKLASIPPPPTPLAVEWRAVSLNYDFVMRDCTPNMLQPVLAAAAELPHLPVSLSFQTLDDVLLDTLMQHGSAIKGVTADNLQLQDTRHGCTVRPWGLSASTVATTLSLLCVPPPGSGNQLVDGVKYLSFDLTPEQVQARVADAVTARTQQLGVGVHSPVCINITAPAGLSSGDQPAMLRANLQLLRTMKLTNTEEQPSNHATTISLDKWTLKQAVIVELAGLPQWGGTLSLERSVRLRADAAPEVYRMLGRVVPVAYSKWSVHCKLAVEQLVEVCLGVGDARWGRGLRPLELEMSGWKQLPLLESAVEEHCLAHAVHVCGRG